MSDLSLSPSYDDSTHAVLVAVGEKMLVGNGLGPEYLQDFSKVFVVKGGQFVEIAFSYCLAL